MKKKVAIIMMILSLAVLISCTGEKKSDAESSKKVVIKLGHVLSVDNSVHKSLVNMSERIKKRTEGNVEIQIYPNGELPTNQNAIELIRSNAAYISYCSPGNLTDYVPEFITLQSPFLFKDYDAYYKFIETETVKGFIKKAEENGIRVLSLNWLNGYRNILSDKDIKNADDVKNLKIRVPNNKVWVAPFEALGTNATTLPWSEAYTALQQGVIDAVECTSGILYDAKMFELKKKIALTQHILDVSGMFIGEGFWQKIPAEYQNVIAEEIKNTGYEASELAKASDEKKKELMMSEGVVYNEVDNDSFRSSIASLVSSTYPGGEAVIKEMEKIYN